MLAVSPGVPLDHPFTLQGRRHTLQDVVDGVLAHMTLKDLLRTEREVTASVSAHAVPLTVLSTRRAG